MSIGVLNYDTTFSVGNSELEIITELAFISSLIAFILALTDAALATLVSLNLSSNFAVRLIIETACTSELC